MKPVKHLLRLKSFIQLAMLEEDLAQHEDLLSSAEAEVAALRLETDERQHQLEITSERLSQEEELVYLCLKIISFKTLRLLD